MKNTYKVALSGTLSALAVGLMLLTGVIPIGTYAFPAFAGVFIMVLVVEFRYKWALGAYFVVSVLSGIFVPEKEAALLFILFFGYYPILKMATAKIKYKSIQWIIKLLVFNISMIGIFFISIYLLGIPKESYNIFNVYLPYVFLAIGNVFLFIYDFFLTTVMFKYCKDIRPKIMKNMK